MTFRQLECFLAVARERSFGRGAKRVHLSQPTLSQHVQELERELGHQLFTRRRREIALTEAGRVFEPCAARVVAATDDARQAVVDLGGLNRGSLLVGGSTTPGIYVLPHAVALFRRRHPGIQLTLHIANTRIIEERVRASELDLGVVGGHVLGPGERCISAGLVDELVLVAPPRHDWARRGGASQRDVATERLLVREAGSATRQVMERALQQAGITPAETMELNHTEAIKECVIAGLGVAFVSSYAVRREVRARQLAVIPVRGLHIRRHFHVIHAGHRTLGASGRAFLAILDELGKRPSAKQIKGGGAVARPGTPWSGQDVAVEGFGSDRLPRRDEQALFRTIDAFLKRAGGG
jgi:DNA-binding transcriptional LysR family regulator